MKYFDHDTDACKDELVQALRIECGGAAVDAYWAILEMIYRDETDLVLEKNQPLTKSVTHWLCIDWETLKTYFSTMHEIGLFNVSENSDGAFVIHSERASENIAKYQKRLEAARENGKKGGRKPKANRTKTKAKANPNQTLTQPKTKEKEKEKLLVTHKGLPNNCASDGAAVAGATPPAAEDETRIPICPLCQSPVRFDAKSTAWKCPTCGTVKAPAYKAVDAA